MPPNKPLLLRGTRKLNTSLLTIYFILDSKDQQNALYTIHRNESEFTNYTINRSDITEKCCRIESGNEKKNTIEETFDNCLCTNPNDHILAHFISLSLELSSNDSSSWWEVGIPYHNSSRFWWWFSCTVSRQPRSIHREFNSFSMQFDRISDVKQAIDVNRTCVVWVIAVLLFQGPTNPEWCEHMVAKISTSTSCLGDGFWTFEGNKHYICILWRTYNLYVCMNKEEIRGIGRSDMTLMNYLRIRSSSYLTCYLQLHDNIRTIGQQCEMRFVWTLQPCYCDGVTLRILLLLLFRTLEPVEMSTCFWTCSACFQLKWKANE